MQDLPTQRLENSPQGIARAAEILRDGGLVAFPTETVYGLGADARDDRAVARIFEAKGRPSFNPLIVHVPDIAAAQTFVEWSDLADKAARFWPGPLTMVLPRRADAGLSRLVSAGMETVAIRIPEAQVAQDLLRAFSGPIAAPSANPSGQISPTRADHVLDGLSGRIEAVLDGGRCAMGLESTILGLSGRPTLLRLGGVTLEALTEALGTRVAERRDSEQISAPGQLASHYAPRATVRLNATEFLPGEARLGFGPLGCDLNLSEQESLTEAAANLFEYMHRLDATGAQVIAVAPIPHVGLGLAINDRLSRAAAER